MYENIDRRTFVSGISAGTIAAIAGCSGDSGSGDGSSGDGSSSDGSSGDGDSQTSQSNNSGGTLRISALSLNPHEQAAFDRFNEETDWTVEQMELPNTQYKNALGTWLGGSNAPDVYFYWSGPARGGAFVAQGNALKLNEYMDQEYLDGFFEGLISMEQYEGRDIFSWRNGEDIYGVPTTHTPYALWYNKNVLDDVGIDYSGWDNKTDMTASEFEDICQQIKDAGYTPAVSGNKGQWNYLYFIAWALQKHAGAETYVNTALNRNDKPWTDSDYVEAMTYLQEWTDQYLIDGANGISDGQAQSLFFDDQVAFASWGMWAKQNAGATAPDFDTERMGFMWWPYFPDKYSEGQNERVGGGGDAYHVSARAEQRGNAEMAATYLTDYHGSDQFAKDMVSSPMNNTPARDVWDEFDDLTHIQQLGHDAQQLLNDASAYAAVPDLVCPPQQSNAWLSGGQSLITGDDPASILQTIEEARQADIEQYG